MGSLLGKTEKMLPDLRQIGKERHPCQGLGKEAFRIFELQKGVQCGWGVVSEADGVKRRGGGRRDQRLSATVGVGVLFLFQ